MPWRLHEISDYTVQTRQNLGQLTKDTQQLVCQSGIFYQLKLCSKLYLYNEWPLLLTWFNFNPSMDK